MYFDRLIALALLASDQEIKQDFSHLVPVILQIAIEKELVGPVETKLYFSEHESPIGDMEYLRKYYREFKDTPYLGDVKYFPTLSTLLDGRNFNEEYRKSIARFQSIETYQSEKFNWCTSVLIESEFLYQIWDNAFTAANENYYYVTRRMALKNLKKVLGNDLYYSGQLPPVVPEWRFWEIK